MLNKHKLLGNFNTLSNKASDYGIAKWAIDIKSVLEKLERAGAKC